MNKKKRRHSGWVTPRLNKGTPIKELIEDGIEPRDYWDDWKDYRDGFRGRGDRKYLRFPYSWLGRHLDFKRWNSRLKKLILRRKIRKLKRTFPLN